MAEDFVSYDRLIDRALRSVVRETLRYVGKNGLTGQHHIYLSFQTDFPKVEIADYLHQEYPDEMTIVLQHQFWGLEVGEDAFSIGLTFNKVEEKLVVPFDAITRFADPSVQFGLQFQTSGRPSAAPLNGEAGAPDPLADAIESPTEQAADETGADVITLDTFRKK